MRPAGRLFGIGLGPGDPELVTLKAVRRMADCDVIAFFAKAGRASHARRIAAPFLPERREELPLAYPVTTEIPVHDAAYNACLAPFYESAAALLAARLEAGCTVGLLCEGDPLFYGSFMHLFVRLRAQFPVTIVPGVSGMSGCWTAAGLPMSWGDDVLTVVPATLPLEDLRARLAGSDAAVVMKIGRNLPKVQAAVAAVGLMRDAIYVERGTMEGERILPLAEVAAEEAPYFAVVLLPGHGRRP